MNNTRFQKTENIAQIQLVYVSATTRPFLRAELADLLLRARTHNSSIEVTGLLLYHKLSFFQILEGDDRVVVPLYKKIECDPRHDQILMLSRKEVTERNFGDWSMGFVDLDRESDASLGFRKLLAAKSSFLALQGDVKLVAKLIDGFQEGRWRRGIS